jgi:hypothetical protein
VEERREDAPGRPCRRPTGPESPRGVNPGDQTVPTGITGPCCSEIPRRRVHPSRRRTTEWPPRSPRPLPGRVWRDHAGGSVGARARGKSEDRSHRPRGGPDAPGSGGTGWPRRCTRRFLERSVRVSNVPAYSRGRRKRQQSLISAAPQPLIHLSGFSPSHGPSAYKNGEGRNSLRSFRRALIERVPKSVGSCGLASAPPRVRPRQAGRRGPCPAPGEGHSARERDGWAMIET